MARLETSVLHPVTAEAFRLSGRNVWTLSSHDRVDFGGRSISRAPVSSDIDVSTLHRFFDDKVAGVRRASTAGADSPTFTTVGCELRLFTPVSSADVVELMKKLPDKQCTSDPLPTWLLKQFVEVLAPFLCRLFNWSLQSGTVPSTFKFAYITHAVTEESRSGCG